MNRENLLALKEKLSQLSEKEEKQRNLYLRGLASGELQGPPVGYPSIDKPWLKFYDEEAIKATLPKMTAYEYIYSNNKNYLNDVAIIYFGNRISYKNLFKKIDDTARALQAMGIKKGDVVTICSVTTPEVIYLFYALNRLGAIANMIDPRTNVERIIEIINKTSSDMMFFINLVYPKIEKMRDRLVTKKYVSISPYDSLLFPINLIKNTGKDVYKLDGNKYMSWKEFFKHKNEVNKVNDVPYVEDYPVGIVYTGGTTGVPKGAVLSNDNFNGLAFNYANANLGIKRQQTILDIMPPFIAYGLNNGIHLPLSVGVTDILIPKFVPAEFPDLILKYKPNDCLGVPSHFDILMKSEKLKNADLSFLVYPAAGGDAMNIALEEKLNIFLKEHNCTARITKGYGMTELSGAAITSSTTINKVGSVGVPFPYNNLGIFEEGTDIELPIGEIGEICITAPTIMHGYLNNDEEEKKVKKVHSDGKTWIHSQDYGYVDENGMLYIKGRMKRTIVRPDGHNNYPLEIENVINSHDLVHNSAVVPMETLKHGNGSVPVAFVEIDKEVDTNRLKNELIKMCAEKLPNRDIACNYVFLENLPVTNIGKIDYNELKRILDDIVKYDKQFVDEVYDTYSRSLVLK